jgi:hypothetical protein
MAENLVNVQNADGTRVGTSGTISGNVTVVPFSAVSAVSNSVPVTTPAALATIASGSLPAGTYDIFVQATVGGTVAAVDLGNMTFAAAALTARLANANNGSPGSFGPFQVTLSGIQAITIAAVNLATTGAVYAATITATRVF